MAKAYVVYDAIEIDSVIESDIIIHSVFLDESKAQAFCADINNSIDELEKFDEDFKATRSKLDREVKPVSKQTTKVVYPPKPTLSRVITDKLEAYKSLNAELDAWKLECKQIDDSAKDAKEELKNRETTINERALQETLSKHNLTLDAYNAMARKVKGLTELLCYTAVDLVD